MSLVVHMVANAHLDPAWLWTWPEGVDEVLNTTHTVCDLLDEYPELVFTRGEAWFHEIVRRLDPVLFARVRTHVGGGRWQIVNGWWLQPDCNLPTADSFRKHGEIGKRWFRERLGVDVTVGYNIDSFGHCATLPMFLREAGMDAYVFSRPGEGEMDLPANVLLWRAPNGDAVTACRVNHCYCTRRLALLRENLERAAAGAQPGIGHVMCFYGLGDHGGGPSREQIEWILEHRGADGIELRFSHPRAFFDAVRASGAPLPEVHGPLHHHAVGCYSVVHDLKQQMRRAENLAAQAERLLDALGGDEAERARLDGAWERILFNQFHDVLCGTSVPEACEHARDELGQAKAVARELIVAATRRDTVSLPGSRRQRIVLYNASDRPFSGFIEWEPWLGYYPHDEDLRFEFVDEDGNVVHHQRLRPVSASANCRYRVLIHAELPPLGRRVLEVCRGREEMPPARVSASALKLENRHLAVGLGVTGIPSATTRDGGIPLFGPGGLRFAVFEDLSDTWSHGSPVYDGREVATFTTEAPWTVLEDGPLRAGAVNTLKAGASTLVCHAYLQAGEPVIRLRLRLDWHGSYRIVKMIVPPGFGPIEHMDGCPGGVVRHRLDDIERPVHDFTALHGDGRTLAVVSGDIYSADVQAEGTIRPTLLRCPAYAHHDPFKLPAGAVYRFTDQGEHEYEVAVMATGTSLREARCMADEAARQRHPIWIAENTRGMPEREYPGRSARGSGDVS